VTAADVLYGLAIVAGAIVLVAAEELLATWAVRRSTQAILGRRRAENAHGGAEKPNAPDYSEASTGTLGLLPSAALRAPRGTPRSPQEDSGTHRDVKPYNTPPRAAGGSDGQR